MEYRLIDPEAPERRLTLTLNGDKVINIKEDIMSDPKLEAQWERWGDNIGRHRQAEREAHKETYLEENMDEERLRKKEEDISQLAQKLYSDDGHMGDIYEAEPATLRFYENAALELIGGE